MAALLTAACTDDDSFSTNRNDLLTFSCDTVSMDTVFSTVPTSTYSFWVYNNSDDGLRIKTVRLQRGNQSGYRVNVDGTFLDTNTGSQASDFEVRKGDSLRVFVELTSPINSADSPQLVEDNLVFLLESGVEQNVLLRAYSWDAELLSNVVISKDSTLSSTKPIVIYGGIKVDSAATLTVNAPTRLYFHDGAGIDVYGRLVVNGNSGENGDVVMRGDRTDHMFDYLPYDRVSGQWKGIHIHASSTGNCISHADIHSGEYGILCDSAAFDAQTIRLSIDHSTIHNCKGAGLLSHNANIEVANCQITNTLGDCLAVYGGQATVVYCTLAQFYPFSGDRGVALRFANGRNGYAAPLYGFYCTNTLVTGYADDELMGEQTDSIADYNYNFTNCILRTPVVSDSTLLANFKDVLMETPKDSVQGKMHFVNIDETNLRYDFRLDSLSTARNRAAVMSQYADDRYGNVRSATPSIGCYE